MNVEVKTYQNVCAIQFNDLKKEIVDIDCILRQTNLEFIDILKLLEIEIDFDFKKTNNKRLYTHAFIKNITEFIKNNNGNKPYFYSNLLTKDTFRNNLVKKIKRIFGFQVWEDVYEFGTIFENINSCDINMKVYGLLSMDKKPKTMKHIKRYLEKEGLTNLNDVYFQQLSNKIQLLC